MRRVNMYLDEAAAGTAFPAWTDDTHWNGFLNVWLTVEDAHAFAAHIGTFASTPVRIDERGIMWPEPSEEEALLSGPLTLHPALGVPVYSFAGGAGCFNEKKEG